MTIGERIKKARENAQLTQDQLAEKVGVSRPAVTQWEQGKTQNLKANHLYEMARVLRVDPAWILGLQSSAPANTHFTVAEESGFYGRRSTDTLMKSEFDFIPLFDQEISAGEGSYPSEFESLETSLAFRAEWLHSKGLNKNHLCVAHVKGESMADQIRDGDVLLIDTNDTTLRDNRIYAFRFDGTLKVKRVFWQMTGLLLRSDNPDYPDETIPKSELENLHVVGRVVWNAGTPR